MPLIEAAFPGTVGDGAVDRAELSKQVTGNPEATKRLQAIVYPLMAGERQKFLEEAQASGADIVVFDIPPVRDRRRGQHGCGCRRQRAMPISSARGCWRGLG